MEKGNKLEPDISFWANTIILDNDKLKAVAASLNERICDCNNYDNMDDSYDDLSDLPDLICDICIK